MGPLKEYHNKFTELKARKNRLEQEEMILIGFTSPYEEYFKFEKFYEPHYLLWTNAEKFLDKKKLWKGSPASTLDIAEIENLKNEVQKTLRKIKNKLEGKQKEVMDGLSRQIKDLESWMHIIETLSNPGLKPRHWKLISESAGPDLDFKKLSVDRIKFLQIEHMLGPIIQISEDASKEYSLEKYLDSMDTEIESKNKMFHDSKGQEETKLELINLINEQLDNIKTLRTNKHIEYLIPRVDQKENDLNSLLESLENE